MKDFDDNNLKSFLQRHQPKAPAGPEQELNQILKKIKPTSSFRFKWFAIPTAVAAGLMAFWISMQPSTLTVPTPEKSVSEQPIAEAPQVALLDDEDIDFFEDEKPTLEIGQDYLTLAGL